MGRPMFLSTEIVTNVNNLSENLSHGLSKHFINKEVSGGIKEFKKLKILFLLFLDIGENKNAANKDIVKEKEVLKNNASIIIKSSLEKMHQKNGGLKEIFVDSKFIFFDQGIETALEIDIIENNKVKNMNSWVKEQIMNKWSSIEAMHHWSKKIDSKKSNIDSLWEVLDDYTDKLLE